MIQKWLLVLLLAFGCAPLASITGSSTSALSAHLPLQDAGVYRMAEWVRSEDCGGVFCDLGPAFTRAIADCKAHPVHIRKYVGCKYLLPAGEFYLSTGVVLDLQSVVEGFSGSFWGAGTLINGPVGKTAFNATMGGSEFRDFALAYSAPVAGTSTIGVTPTIGIDLSGRCSAERIWMRGPTVGIVVGDANVTRIRDVVIDTTEFAGVLIGPPAQNNDANAGLYESISVVSACRRGDRWAKHFGRTAGAMSCGGIIDRSALGNTQIGHHTAGAYDIEAFAAANLIVDPNLRLAAQIASRRPGYILEGNSSVTPAIGLYSENDQALSYVGPSGQAIGGRSLWQGPGLRFNGNIMTSLVVINDSDPNNRTEMRMGAAAGGGSFFELKAVPSNKSFRAKYELGLPALRLDWQNLNSAVAGRIYLDGRTSWKPY